MKVVLDTTAIIYLNDFRNFDEIFTINEVVEEVKDKISSIKLSGMKLNVLEPGNEVVKQVKTAADKTGDLKKLSITDIKVLALAKERNLVIISDDYSIQNVAQKLGITYLSLFNKKITKFIEWAGYCSSCKEFVSNKGVCLKCGGQLVRKPKKAYI